MRMLALSFVLSHSQMTRLTERRTDRQTEFLSLDLVCILCGAVKMCAGAAYLDHAVYTLYVLPKFGADQSSGVSVSVFEVGIGIRYFAIIYNFWCNTATAMRVGSFDVHVGL